MRISKNATASLLTAFLLLPGWSGLAHAASAANPEESINTYLASPNVPEKYKKAVRKKLKERDDKKAKREKLRREGKGRDTKRAGMKRRLYKIAGGIVRTEGAELIVPPGALPSDMAVSLARPVRNQDAARAAKLTAAGQRGVSRAVALGPEATALAVPATVVFPYDPAKLDGLKETDLKIHAWNQALGTWEPLSSKVDTGKKTVSAQVSRLTTVQLLSGGAGNR